MGASDVSDGLIYRLFVKPDHGVPMVHRPTLELITSKGIKGDQAFGRKSRQVLLVDLDQLLSMELKPGDLRENITVRGLSIDSLPVGTRLVSDDVRLRIVSICDPCSKLEKVRPGLMQASEGMRGMLAVIENGGTLCEGHRISVISTDTK